ncbi:hypothetical protein Cni_G06523 [Canna indica]|uniref:Uncharacterized protein n=1 Tax=Canna indica TaxID=4628 RepID=A0AAQ3Q434_9LILI|nr:hypothetical protein Cni_G06523 [Canna indica]
MGGMREVSLKGFKKRELGKGIEKRRGEEPASGSRRASCCRWSSLSSPESRNRGRRSLPSSLLRHLSTDDDNDELWGYGSVKPVVISNGLLKIKLNLPVQKQLHS